MPPTSRTKAVLGIVAPRAKPTWQAAALAALGLSSAFLIVWVGFTAALAFVWPG